MIRAVIFDLDGVLVDAAEWHYQALNRALKLFSYSLSDKAHNALYNGLPTAAKLELLSQLSSFPRGLAKFVNQMKQDYTHELLANHCRPVAAITQMLRELEAAGYWIAVGSNSQRHTIHTVLKQMEIESFFDVIVSQEDVKRAKPHPDVYQACLEQLGLKAEECLIVEDSRPGIQAARSVTGNVLVATHPSDVSWDWLRKALERLNLTQPRLPELEIVIPMAGLGSRFREAGYQVPKPFIPVHGKPMIEWVVRNLSSEYRAAHFTFLCHAEHLRTYPVEQHLRQIAPGCSIVPVPETTEGAACTVLLAIDEVVGSRPLLLANSDQYVDYPLTDFLTHAQVSGADGMILTFNATESKWSYAAVDENQRVTQVAEKRPISEHATVGIYYFRRAADFFEGARQMIRKNLRTNNEFYVCPVYNELIERGLDIRIFSIPPERMHGLGTPQDLESFLQQAPLNL